MESNEIIEKFFSIIDTSVGNDYPRTYFKSRIPDSELNKVMGALSRAKPRRVLPSLPVLDELKFLFDKEFFEILSNEKNKKEHPKPKLKKFSPGNWFITPEGDKATIISPEDKFKLVIVAEYAESEKHPQAESFVIERNTFKNYILSEERQLIKKS